MKEILLSLLVCVLVGGAVYLSLYSSVISESTKLTAYQKWVDEKVQKKRQGHAKADAPEMMGVIARELRTKLGESGPQYGPNQVMNEYQAAKNRQASVRTRANTLEFMERGPGNVAGRTRALLIDPDDETSNTWLAGSASGGIWKTTDGGENWTYVSDEIPNLGTNTLAMSSSNTSIIYAGTGEHFTNDIDGAGLFKSTDKGESWTQVASPDQFSDFQNVSRIVVDPYDANIVIATTRNSVWSSSFEAAIYKTTDGGENWRNVLSSTTQRFDDIDYDPGDFNTLYVAVEGEGVIKSTNGGVNWESASLGMTPSGRVEITVSEVNTDRIWASVEGDISGSGGSDLYVSDDGAASWSLVVNEDERNEEGFDDFLGGQGWYDNIIVSHPFDEDIVYVGGVNSWKFELTENDDSELTTLDISQNATDFMSFLNFGGGYLNGGMELGEVGLEDALPIEIRFGEGTQKAHRFTVGGQGAGVEDANYIYEDYVEVPFQVWDTDNDVQLMAAFRDQEEDGSWNLIEENTEGAASTHSREYLYIYDVTYSEDADATIGQDGGVGARQMYFFWPILPPNETFDSDNLPVSSLSIEKVNITAKNRTTTIISDAYDEYEGPNSFPQSDRVSGLHPDQHGFFIGDIDTDAETFRLYITNDGGVYESVASTDPGPNEGDFTYVSYGYNTTQFYGADKPRGEDRYIGGMQDNGTWFNPEGTEGSATVNAEFAIGGDGFEVLWHSHDADKMIGGYQYNGFFKTSDGGDSWTDATTGFGDTGPFISRLAHSKSNPDVIFTVGSAGVWKSESFGDRWTASTMNDQSLWAFSNSTDVEVSVATPDIIWAGTYLSSDGRPHVSTDGGDTFNAVSNYDFDENMGPASGLATHPGDDSTAYILFSYAGHPKVLKTEDLGENWTDISGFDDTGDRGFPDVAINCLFVFPTDNNRIWAGSEIGIIESLDGGESWNLLVSDFPPVNTFDFKLVDNILVIATYGRGIWSVDLALYEPPMLEAAYTSPDGMIHFSIDFEESFERTAVYIENELAATLGANEVGSITETIENQGYDGNVEVLLVSALNGATTSEHYDAFLIEMNQETESYGTNFTDASSSFVGNGFTIGTQSGYSSPMLHSTHPYESNAAYYYYLKTPIVVGGSNTRFEYEDVALVNTSDYVTIEGSVDGTNWISLKDTYNASYSAKWVIALNDEDGSSELLENHSIDLLDHFLADDLVMFRFRLRSEEGSSSYGWAIDNLYIQEEALGIEDENENAVLVYPTYVRSGEVINIENLESNAPILVYSLNGSIVETIQRSSGLTESWSTSRMREGLYILVQDNQSLAKVVVQ